MAIPAAKMAIDWVLADPNLTPTGIAKMLGAFKHHTIEIEIENLTSDVWDIDYYVNHGVNADNPVKTLNAATPTKAEGTILGLEGAGVGTAGTVVLTRKRDNWSCAAWASNLAGGTCQFQLMMGYNLKAGLMLTHMMDNLPRHSASTGFLDKYGNGVHINGHMTGVNTSVFIIQLSDAPLARGTLKSVKSQNAMVAPKGTAKDSLIYCPSTGSPLTFMFQGNEDGCNFRVPGKNLFLNYRDLTGAVKLYDDAPLDGLFSVASVMHGFTIKSKSHNQYMWLDNSDEPYVTSSGDSTDISAHWKFGLPF